MATYLQLYLGCAILIQLPPYQGRLISAGGRHYTRAKSATTVTHAVCVATPLVPPQDTRSIPNEHYVLDTLKVVVAMTSLFTSYFFIALM
jgi:hypothetical protein